MLLRSVTHADIDAGQVTNTATVTSLDPNDVVVDDDSGATINDDDDTVTPICQTAAIALVKEADVTLTNGCLAISVGQVINYDFTVTNEGNVSLDTVVLTDALLPDEGYVSGDLNTDGILQVDETWLYTGNHTVTQADIDAGEVTNTATVTSLDRKSTRLNSSH